MGLHADPSPSAPHLWVPCFPTHQARLAFLEGRFHLQLPTTAVYGIPVLCTQENSVVFLISASLGLPGQLFCSRDLIGARQPTLQGSL